MIDENKLKRTANNIASFVIDKNKLYGDSLLQQREFGIYVRMNDKFTRIKNIIDRYAVKYPEYTDKEINTIVNSLTDIIGYALLWLNILDDNAIDTELRNFL